MDFNVDKPQLVNRLHGLPINKKTRHYLSTSILYMGYIRSALYIVEYFVRTEKQIFDSEKKIKA